MSWIPAFLGVSFLSSALTPFTSQLSKSLEGGLEKFSDLFGQYFTVTVDSVSNSAAHVLIRDYLATIPSLIQGCKNVSIVVKDDIKKTQIVPGVGVHKFQFMDVDIHLAIEKEKDGRETYYLQVKTQYKNVLLKFIQEAEIHFYRGDKIKIWSNRDEDWELVLFKDRRNINTLALSNQALHLVSEIRNFYDRKSFYKEHNIPWRRGYLLSGKPGTGKSSLLFALASEFQRDIYYLRMADMTINDHSFLSLVSKIPEQAFFVIEDVDVNGLNHPHNEMAGGLSLSGLLNGLDGIPASEGRVLFMTTNHIGVLPPALKRPGRVDEVIIFPELDDELASKLFRIFYRNDNLLASFLLVWNQHRNKIKTPAILQEIFLKAIFEGNGTMNRIDALMHEFQPYEDEDDEAEDGEAEDGDE